MLLSIVNLMFHWFFFVYNL